VHEPIPEERSVDDIP